MAQIRPAGPEFDCKLRPRYSCLLAVNRAHNRYGPVVEISEKTYDSAIHDPARIMRLPGFVNHKEPEAVCRVIDVRPERIELKSLLNVLDTATLKPEPDSQVLPEEKPSKNNNDGCEPRPSGMECVSANATARRFSMQHIW